MEYVIEMLNITKEFPGIKANDNITLQLKKGEIHALLGENGAGKSTLMSILFGLYQPDSGWIKIKGQLVKINNPNDANRFKIGMVHQHFKLVETFSVLDNIILGTEECKNGFLVKENARKQIMILSKQYNLNIDPDAIVKDITVGMQQRVEILKMLFRDNEILIFDEPTAMLTPQEIDELLKIMKSLVREGKSIIFITHKLNEIKMAADRCTIICKGKYIDTVNVQNVSKEQLSRKMVGRDVNLVVEKEICEPGEIVLKVENLNYSKRGVSKKILSNINFEVKQNEIVCLAGIEGNGQSELIYAITGMLNGYRGKITLNNKDITNSSIRQRNLEGIAHIPEDRHKYGLVLDYNLAENMILKNYFTRDNQKWGFLRFDHIYKQAQILIKNYDIRSGQGAYLKVRELSGGNQQKAIIAREINSNCDLLIAVQPTRGLDIGAIEFIHEQLIQYRNNRHAVLLVSLELDEVMSISDRILVMHEGQIVGNLDPKKVNAEELGLYMSGSKRGVNDEK